MGRSLVSAIITSRWSLSSEGRLFSSLLGLFIYRSNKSLDYLSFRSADTEAPDQRTRYLKKKKNKKKKKKKKPVEGSGDTEANVSSESLEEVKSLGVEHGKPNSLISCTSENCQKKFTSESALKYHFYGFNQLLFL